MSENGFVTSEKFKFKITASDSKSEFFFYSKKIFMRSKRQKRDNIYSIIYFYLTNLG